MKQKSASSKEHMKPKMHEHHLEIHPSTNDGYTVKHMMEREPQGDFGYKPSPEEGDSAVFQDGPHMIEHVMDHHGIGNAEMIAHLEGKEKEEPGGGDEKHEAPDDKEDKMEEA